MEKGFGAILVIIFCFWLLSRSRRKALEAMQERPMHKLRFFNSPPQPYRHFDHPPMHGPDRPMPVHRPPHGHSGPRP